jgi:pimeloyl-ACP methyl ester carboxylesterase
LAVIARRTIEANGLRIHFAEAGAGPLIVLCHGFPESWYSWRAQLQALAEAGYRAVAPDMRGYGQSGRPEDIEKFTVLHLVDDMVAVLDALGADTATIAGHDMGALVAWRAALLRPDRFRAVIALSVPFVPRGPARPTTTMPQNADALFYQLYFQPPGVAEAELERAPRDSILRLLYSASGEGPRRSDRVSADLPAGMVPRGGGYLTGTTKPAILPSWLREADVDFYAAEFLRTGFSGGLNWYRNVDRDWELLAPYAGMLVKVPALYVVGERDIVLAFPGVEQLIESLAKFVPALRARIVLPGCGHWTQQERPEEVNAAMIDFLRGIE